MRAVRRDEKTSSGPWEGPGLLQSSRRSAGVEVARTDTSRPGISQDQTGGLVNVLVLEMALDQHRRL